MLVRWSQWSLMAKEILGKRYWSGRQGEQTETASRYWPLLWNHRTTDVSWVSFGWVRYDTSVTHKCSEVGNWTCVCGTGESKARLRVILNDREGDHEGTIWTKVYQGLSQGSGATKLGQALSSGLPCSWTMKVNDLALCIFLSFATYSSSYCSVKGEGWINPIHK